MITLFKEGGFSMWFILALGFVALATAFWYALRPDERHLGFIAWISRAILWASVGGVLVDLSTVAHVAAGFEEAASDKWRYVVMQGFGESMAPGVMGTAFLMVVSTLTAVGKRKLDAAKAA